MNKGPRILAIDCDALEAAYKETLPRLRVAPENAEEWIVNLHNHLVWGSYAPGADADADAIVLSAMNAALEQNTGPWQRR